MKYKQCPDFLIVGSMKAGTTSLRNWLNCSSSVALNSKEVHFFDSDRRYELGKNMYQEILPKREHGTVLVGDDTPTYSYLPHIPFRIYKTCPEVKILWVLRDPLRRSISQYWHACRAGIETRNIDEAFNQELDGKTVSIWQQYLKRSLYSRQILRYFEFFNPEKILFLKFEDLVADNFEEKHKVFDFLGIEPLFESFPHSHVASYYPKPFVNKLLKYWPISRGKKFISAKSGFSQEKIPKLNYSTANRASNFLRKDLLLTEKLTGLSFVL